MTPAASWSPADYYTASRAARRAFEAQDQQLSLGLDEADRGKPVGLVEPSCANFSPEVAGGLALNPNGRSATFDEDARCGRKEVTP